jgi:hypothetical protein
MQTTLSPPELISTITLFQERMLAGKSGQSKTSVTRYIPIRVKFDNSTAYPIQRIIDTSVTDAVMAYLEDVSDARTVQAIEYYLNDHGLSLSRLCQQPQRITDAFYLLWKQGADIVIEQIIEVAYRTFGFKYEVSTLGLDSHTKLADSLAILKRMILEDGQSQVSS